MAEASRSYLDPQCTALVRHSRAHGELRSSTSRSFAPDRGVAGAANDGIGDRSSHALSKRPLERIPIGSIGVRSRFSWLRMSLPENRCPPRIKSGAGFVRDRALVR